MLYAQTAIVFLNMTIIKIVFLRQIVFLYCKEKTMTNL